MPEYYYIYTKRDVLEYFQDKDYPEYKPERFLLLHPTLIENELKKVDSHSMIYTDEYPSSEENELFFIPENPVKHRIVRFTCTHDILKLIPKEVIFPIGGLTGRYYIKLSGIDERDGRRFYDVYDRHCNRCVIKGIPIDKFYYLDNDYAVLDSFIIMRGGIVEHTRLDRYSYDKNKGCLLIKRDINPRYERGFSLYNSNGNLLEAAYSQSEVDETIKDLPDTTPPQLPTQVNAQMFRLLIAEQLRNCKVIPGCETDDLVNIANYLHEKGLDLVVDLDTLQVCQVDFAKYFKKTNDAGVSSGPQHVMRLVSQNNNNKH